MFNIDETVIVKATILGVEKDNDGKFIYTIGIKAAGWERPERVKVTEDTIRRNCFMTMDELEEVCKED